MLLIDTKQININFSFRQEARNTMSGSQTPFRRKRAAACEKTNDKEDKSQSEKNSVEAPAIRRSRRKQDNTLQSDNQLDCDINQSGSCLFVSVLDRNTPVAAVDGSCQSSHSSNADGSCKGIVSPSDTQGLLNARLTSSFFDQPCCQLARSLLGKRLVRHSDDGCRLVGTIVETEAYLGPEDRAAHSFGGKRTPRNEAMFMAPGTSYVYNIYGMYSCMNISSQGMTTRMSLVH